MKIERDYKHKEGQRKKERDYSNGSGQATGLEPAASMHDMLIDRDRETDK